MFVSFFFFEQKTAYEMRMIDWSSDVCSSDLDASHAGRADRLHPGCTCREVPPFRHRDDHGLGDGGSVPPLQGLRGTDQRAVLADALHEPAQAAPAHGDSHDAIRYVRRVHGKMVRESR